MAVVMWNPGPGAFWTTNSGANGNAVRRRRRGSVATARRVAANLLAAAYSALRALCLSISLPRLSKRRRLQIEAALIGLFFLTAVCITGGALIAGARAAVNAVTSYSTTHAAPSAAASACTITLPVRVAPGDSLWKLAGRYGDPDAYILDRVDDLAHANGLPAHARLVPGQRLLVPVRNPVELARLRTNVAMAR